MIRSAVWFITWNCQNHCQYCWERQRQVRGEFTPEKFQDWKAWADGWNRLVNLISIGFIMDISGGEPFIQPGFIDMLKALDNDIRIAITTNLQANIVPFVREISPSKVFSMTLSYHPSEMDLNHFLGKALLLKNKGFTITVNFVAWPEQMYLLPIVKKAIEENGIRFHVDPYAATPYMPYELDEKEKAFLYPYVGIDRKPIVEKRNVKCSAGMDHLTVMPDGNIYRCINDVISGAQPLGNMFENNFLPNQTETFCAIRHECAGCNRDKVTVQSV
jgi:MoaA/NifB/PqqE/SkfB family radical SAM enzyme